MLNNKVLKSFENFTINIIIFKMCFSENTDFYIDFKASYKKIITIMIPLLM